MMTEEKNEYLAKKLRKKIKKEVFALFPWVENEHKDDKNWGYEVRYYTLADNDGVAYYNVYIGDYRLKSEEKFNGGVEPARAMYENVGFNLSCYVSSRSSEYDDFCGCVLDEDDSLQIGGFILARLMHYSKKYDRKFKNQEATNEPTTN